MRLFQSRKKSQLIAGIDVGWDAVRIVQLNREGADIRLRKAIELLWPDGVSISDRGFDPSVLGKMLSKMLIEAGVQIEQVCSAIPLSAVFLKRVRAPDVPTKELKAYLELEALNIVPASGGDVCIDFQVIRRLADGDLELLLVAAKKEPVDFISEVMSEAGLDLVVIDVDAFAIDNTFEFFGSSPRGRATAIVHLGVQSSTVSFRVSGQLMYAGDLACGGDSMRELIAYMNPAEAVKDGVDNFEHIRFRDNIGIETNNTLGYLIDHITRRIKLIWQIADLPGQIESIILCGEGAYISGISSALEQMMGCSVELHDPIRLLESKFGKASNSRGDFTIAAGLAIRSKGDKIGHI